jgi:hypothetical protein
VAAPAGADTRPRAEGHREPHSPGRRHGGGIPTTAWIFLLIGLICGGAVGYSLRAASGPRTEGGMPSGPADIMAGMGAGGPAMGGGGSGSPPPSGKPANVMAMVQQYRGTLAKDPADLQANIGLANLLFDSGQWQKAVDHYERALEKDPKNPDVRVDMAIALHNLGQDPRAVEEMKRVTRESPAHKMAWLNLGVVSSGMGDRATAIQAWERYLTLDPNGPHATSIREQIEHLKRGG